MTPWSLQHARLPCPSLSSGVCSNSCLLSHWCYLTISSSAALSSFCPQPFPASRFFPVMALRLKWPKYWNFSFSPSNGIFRVDLRQFWDEPKPKLGDFLKYLLSFSISPVLVQILIKASWSPLGDRWVSLVAHVGATFLIFSTAWWISVYQLQLWASELIWLICRCAWCLVANFKGKSSSAPWSLNLALGICCVSV